MKNKSALMLVTVFRPRNRGGRVRQEGFRHVAVSLEGQAGSRKALLAVAKQQAGKGSWERIGVGRVYYLGGMKAEGQAIFDEVTGEEARADRLVAHRPRVLGSRRVGQGPRRVREVAGEEPERRQRPGRASARTTCSKATAPRPRRLFDKSFTSSRARSGTPPWSPARYSRSEAAGVSSVFPRAPLSAFALSPRDEAAVGRGYSIGGFVARAPPVEFPRDER